VGGDLIYRVLAAGFWLVLARAVDAPSLGDVALATALSIPVLIVLDGGLAQYLVREARAEHGGRVPHSLRAPLRRRTVLLAGLPLLVSAATALLGSTPDRAWIGVLVGASASFEGMAQAWLAAPRARGDMRPDASFRAVYGACALIAVAVAWAAGWLTGLVAAAATAGGAALAAALALRHLPAGGRWIDRAVTDPRARRGFLQVTLLVTAFASLDVVVVAAVLGSAALAPYALAVKVIATMRVLPIATTRVSLSWAAMGAGPGAADEVRTAARVGLALTVVGLIAGPWGASLLFGEGYGEAMLEPLRILSLAMVPFAVRAPLVGRHLGAGDAGFVARTAAVTLAVGVVALPLGTLALDTTGAALGVLLAELAGASLFVWRRSADGWTLRDIVPSAPAAVVAGAATVAGLLLPAFSPLVLVPAAVAAVASLAPRARLGELRARRAERPGA
jgi:hypothetical protein